MIYKTTSKINLLVVSGFVGVVMSQCKCEAQQVPIMCQQPPPQQQQQQQQFVECVPAIKVMRENKKKEKEEPFIDPWALTADEIIDYDMLPPQLYTALYDNGGFSPGCPGGQTEDDCIRMLGCSWCSWNNLGCVYKDVADLLPISDGEDFCYSANEIGGGEPQEYHWFWFYYGRFYPPTINTV